MWLNSSSIDNEEEEEDDHEDEEEEEETLSIRDEESKTRKLESPSGSVTQEDFNFCSFLKNSTMCSADEVFFQGQILPLHYSSSLPSDSHYTVARGQTTCSEASSTEYPLSGNYTQQIRTESMEHCHSSVGVINSSIDTSITSSLCSSDKPRIRDQFHPQASPTPQVQFSKIKHRNINSSNRKLTMCSRFRVGLVKTPEIALQDLKIRCNKNLEISRSSNNSSSSSSSNDNTVRQQRSLQRKRVFLGSCKCSVNAVETISSKVVTINRGSTNCKEDKKETK